jgi:hypothetical protein
MKKAIDIVAVVSILALRSAAQPTPIAVPLPATNQVAFNEFVALRVASRHRVFPNLVYWGVAGLEWSSLREECTNAAASGSNRVDVGEDSFVRVLHFDATSCRLTGVDYSAEPYAASQEERLAKLRRIQRRLLKEYGQPDSVEIDALNPQNIHILPTGLRSTYLAHWRGLETIVSLDFRKDSLEIRFRPSESGKTLRSRNSSGPSPGSSEG